MTLDIYQVDAFSKGPFTGNPAAVCPLDEWLSESLMQKIALENNLSETAFFVRHDDNYEIRWFTPMIEVDLCGHATLASAHVLFFEIGHAKDMVTFYSKSGSLHVNRKGNLLELNFPADQITKVDTPLSLVDALNAEILECYKGKSDYMVVLENEQAVHDLIPVYSILSTAEARGVIATARSEGEFDFVSRGFFPQSGIDEDPATGSAHTMLTPYWSEKLGKQELKACQLSRRKGFFECQNQGERTLIAGETKLYLKGKIFI